MADQPGPTPDPSPQRVPFPEYRIDIEPEFVAIEVELPFALNLTEAQATDLEARLYDAIDAVLRPLATPTHADLPEPDWAAWECQLTDLPPIDLR